MDPGRVQLLVDSVSNSDAFDAAMGADALAKVACGQHAIRSPVRDGLSGPGGHPERQHRGKPWGNQQALTIYWPMPANADEDGAFYLVHYTAWTVRAPATQVTWLVPRIP